MILRWVREFRQQEQNRRALDAFMRTEYRNEYHRLKYLGVDGTGLYVLDLYKNRRGE